MVVRVGVRVGVGAFAMYYQGEIYEVRLYSAHL